MKKEFAFKLEIRRPDGVVEEMIVHAARVLVGAAAHCDVRIAGESAGREHLVLDLVNGVLRGEARHHAPTPYRGGKPFFEGSLGTEAELAIAGTRLRVSVIEAPRRERAGRAKRFATSMFLGLAVLALPGLVYATLRAEPEAPLGPPPSDVTALFEAPLAACPIANIDQAASSAVSARVLAEQQREQHPFAVSDGLASVRSFDLAAACFAHVGLRTDAVAAVSARDALMKRIDEDYRVHRVRLEHALDEADDKLALREVRVLRRLTAGRRGPYATWLEVVERHLDAATRAAGTVRDPS
jgi:hypothetical protein